MGKILVIGDAMTDIHLECKSDKLSPEAPVPICLLQEKRKILGGSSNVAAQIAIIDGCTMAYIHSDYEYGSNESLLFFRRMCQKKAIALLPLKTDQLYIIPEKSRVWSNKQQVCRIDKEIEHAEFNERIRGVWLQQIQNFIKSNNVRLIILSDYNKGMFDDEFLQNVINMANSHDIITILDPKRPTYRTLSGLSIVTPNNAEMAKTIMMPDELSKSLGDTYLIHTKGADGMDCYKNGLPITNVKAHGVEVADTCGAGDTVVSFIALALQRYQYSLNDMTIRTAMEAASYAASRTVTHHGSYVLTANEVKSVLGFMR